MEAKRQSIKNIYYPADKVHQVRYSMKNDQSFGKGRYVERESEKKKLYRKFGLPRTQL